MICHDMSKKIIDCFIFYNELEMLKFRLNYLYDYVDKFILLESTLTFSGSKKDLYFENNKHLFEKYQDKIIHIIVDDLPFDDPQKSSSENAWVREKLQRNLLERGLKKTELNDDDYIIISDLDEIPDRIMLSKLRQISHIEPIAYALEQDMYYYNLTCKGKNKWYHPKIVSFFAYKNVYQKRADDIRMANRYAVIQKGGWHFSYFGDVNFIQNKIKNFSHQEYNDEKFWGSDNIIKQIQTCGDLFLRDNENTRHFEYCALENNDYLPETYEALLRFCELYKK